MHVHTHTHTHTTSLSDKATEASQYHSDPVSQLILIKLLISFGQRDTGEVDGTEWQSTPTTP